MNDTAHGRAHPLSAAAAAVAEGRADPAALREVQEARERRWSRALRPYVTPAGPERLDERLRELAGVPARAALHGIPVSVKDLFGVADYPIFAGSPQALPPQWEAPGPVVSALQALGAVITGKTHTVEFAFGGLGINPHWPTPRNPWDAAVHRVPGGSSAGAGVSLYCGALLALGTDTAGSVRIPASMTGCVGLKTSHGRWPMQGVVPLSPNFDSIGLLARSAADLGFAFRTLEGALRAGAGEPAAMPRAAADLVIGLGEAFFWDDCSPGVAQAVEAAIGALEAAGARLVRTPLPETAAAFEIFRVGHLAGADLYEFLRSELPGWEGTLDPRVRARMADAATLTAHEYLRRRRELGRLAVAAGARLEAVDVLVTPTVAVTPPPVASVSAAEAYARANILALRNTAMANMLGLCALTLPAGLDAEGLPVGLQLHARHGEDARLVAVAEAVESVLGAPGARLGAPPLGE